jgi:uncharacterized membrane protein YccC
MIRREAIRTALQVAFVSLASYVCGVYFTSFFHAASAGTGGIWALMSGNVVLQETRGKTWSAARLQVLGTFVGAIVSGAYLSLFPFSVVGMAAAVVVTVLVCFLARIPDHARNAALAVSVVMVVSGYNPSLHPVLNSALRLAEACIGTVMASLAVLVWPEPIDLP